MAKHPREENKNNPLRLLRGLLSSKGPEKPIYQKELSRITGVPESTVCAIECGQRKLTGAVLSKVLEQTGAEWDRESRCWLSFFSTDSADTKEPFNSAFYEKFRKRILQRPKDSSELVAGLLFRDVMGMFQMVPDSYWWDLYLRFNRFVSECRKDFDIKKLEQTFYNSTPISSVTAENAYKRSLQFNSAYQGQLSKEGRQKGDYGRLFSSKKTALKHR